MHVDEIVISRIKEHLAHRHWTVYRLHKETGLSTSTLNNIFARNTCPSVTTLYDICRGFGITLEEFFVGVGSRSEEAPPLPKGALSLTDEEEDLVYSFRTLSQADRALLAAYLKGLSKRL